MGRHIFYPGEYSLCTREYIFFCDWLQCYLDVFSSSWFIVLLKSYISLSVFSLVFISITEIGVLNIPTIIVE